MEKNSTVNYYVSKGSAEVTLPDFSGQTGIDAQETLESMGVTVQISKEYSEIQYTEDGIPLRQLIRDMWFPQSRQLENG